MLKPARTGQTSPNLVARVGLLTSAIRAACLQLRTPQLDLVVFFSGYPTWGEGG